MIIFVVLLIFLAGYILGYNVANDRADRIRSQTERWQ
jgi:hypothetical protein